MPFILIIIWSLFEDTVSCCILYHTHYVEFPVSNLLLHHRHMYVHLLVGLHYQISIKRILCHNHNS